MGEVFLQTPGNGRIGPADLLQDVGHAVQERVVLDRDLAADGGDRLLMALGVAGGGEQEVCAEAAYVPDRHGCGEVADVVEAPYPGGVREQSHDGDLSALAPEGPESADGQPQQDREGEHPPVDSGGAGRQSGG
ncbi:hypothetical protein [Streptomyces sp. NPDC002057]|uniref:hypothetical protein n=1 Tax=Streptomyces sp. NPDC002057 TaxID=3154664 RepID=UPI00331E2138